MVVCLGIGACAVYDQPAVLTGSHLEAPPTAAASEIAPKQADAGMQPELAPDALAPDAMETCVTVSDVDPCAALPHLPAAARIDGMLECGLTLHALAVPSAATGTPLPAAAYAAAWSDGGFYVYMEVHAPPSRTPTPTEPLYCGDGVEIFVDSDGQPGTNGAYNAPGTMQFVVAAPAGAAMNTGRFLGGTAQGPWISSNLQVTPLADGYAVEALIVGSDLGLWSWKPSAQLGFNLAVNSAGAGDPRGTPCTTGVGQSVLRVAAPRVDCDGKPWCDTRSFCWPSLGP
jgi:hypothetical protein